MLASKIEMDSRQKLRLKKKLQDQNIIAPGSTAGSKIKVDPLRKVQEDSEKKKKKAKQEGMVGELGRMFLQGKKQRTDKPSKKTDDEGDEDDDDEAQGLWEGWEEDEEDGQLPIDEDEWDVEEEEEVVPKKKPKKEKKDKASKLQDNKGKKESSRENLSRGDPSFRAPDDSPNAHLELSSIRSDNSEYSPQRKVVEGQSVKVPPISQPSKKDDTLHFGHRDENISRQPTFNGSKSGGQHLAIPEDTHHNFNSGSQSRRSSRDELHENGSHSELKRNDSFADAKSQKHSTGSGSKSVLQVKKRDKSNLMNNLARIHAQRLEDANEVVHEEEEDEGEPKDVDWEERIQMLMLAQEVRKFKIPGERMEERAKKRKDKDRGLDKWGVKSVPREKNLEVNKVQYRFKNRIDEDEKKKLMAANIEMLHTDELMAYYRELISKGKRDFTEHQRFQNQIKKLEYENTLCRPESVAKSRSKSPDGQNRIISRFIKDNNADDKESRMQSTNKNDGRDDNKGSVSPTRKGKGVKKPSKSKDKVAMRKTQAY